MARTASATASSEWEGSKKMFVPMEITRRVIGGGGGVEDLVLRVVLGLGLEDG